MNAPTPAAVIAGLPKDPLADFRERMKRVNAREEESRFDDLLREYITNDSKRFAFGGVHNLLASIAGIMEELSQLEGDDFEKAAQAIDQCADECDLKYGEPDAEDERGDAVDRAYSEHRDREVTV